MEENYISQDNSKKWLGVALVVIAGIIIGVVVFLFIKSSRKLISPVPPKPNFEVIFYTPTPGPVSPSATPSATPKVKKALTPTASPKATASATVKPTVKASPSPTTKPTP